MNIEHKFQEQSEAELSILGALLIMPELYPSSAEIISGADFAYDFHRTIFEQIGALYTKTGKCDMTLLLEAILSNSEKYDKTETKEYLMRLADCVPVIDNTKLYCQILKRRSSAWEASKIAVDAVQSGFYHGDDTYETIRSTAEKLAELARDKSQKKSRTLNEVLQDVHADLFGDMPDLSLYTGINALDKLLDGIMPSDLVTVAAATGVGKTAFLLQILANMAKNGKKVLLYSQEMTDKQNALRLIARQAGIDMWKLKKSGRFDEIETKQISEAFDALFKLPIEINDSGGITVENIRLDYISKSDIDVIAVDHVGLMRGEKYAKKSSRYEEITQIMIELRALALQIHKPIIILSQFNRESSKYKNEPDLTSFRDSGEIEQSSSEAVLLWQTEDYEKDGIIGVKVAKNRQGSPGKFYMKFDAPRMNFLEVVYDYAPPKGFKKANREVEELFG